MVEHVHCTPPQLGHASGGQASSFNISSMLQQTFALAERSYRYMCGSGFAGCVRLRGAVAEALQYFHDQGCNCFRLPITWERMQTSLGSDQAVPVDGVEEHVVAIMPNMMTQSYSPNINALGAVWRRRRDELLDMLGASSGEALLKVDRGGGGPKFEERVGQFVCRIRPRSARIGAIVGATSTTWSGGAGRQGPEPAGLSPGRPDSLETELSPTRLLFERPTVVAASAGMQPLGVASHQRAAASAQGVAELQTLVHDMEHESAELMYFLLFRRNRAWSLRRHGGAFVSVVFSSSPPLLSRRASTLRRSGDSRPPPKMSTSKDEIPCRVRFSMQRSRKSRSLAAPAHRLGGWDGSARDPGIRALGIPKADGTDRPANPSEGRAWARVGRPPRDFGPFPL